MSLVKIKDCEVNLSFGHIVQTYENNGNTYHSVQHMDDGQCLDYTPEDLVEYEYYDMLKELMFNKQYNTVKELRLTKSGLTIDGLSLLPSEAKELASDILEFYSEVV